MDAKDENVEIEIWNDPIWTPALDALTSKNDIKPIAELMRAGQPPPDLVAEKLGIMLDPPPGYRGPSLVLKIPKLSERRAIDALVRDIKLRLRIIELTKLSGKQESAIATVSEESGYHRSKLHEVMALEEQEIVRRLLIITGRGYKTRDKVGPHKKPK